MLLSNDYATPPEIVGYSFLKIYNTRLMPFLVRDALTCGIVIEIKHRIVPADIVDARITQTEEKILNQNIQGQKPLDGLKSSPSERFSNYIAYVDESGDANLERIDQGYPVFVLAFCIFHKTYYTQNLVPEVQSFKFNYFGHGMIVLHEKEIRMPV